MLLEFKTFRVCAAMRVAQWYKICSARKLLDTWEEKDPIRKYEAYLL